MVAKPTAITRVGIVQTILAASFVIWLLFFPSKGTNFAWPIHPELNALFIGAGFIMRTFLGIQLWRQKYWHRLRWSVWGNYAFLAVLLVATFWHIEEMNWSSNIVVAHIWVIAYIVEPLVLPLFEPRSPEAKASLPAELRQGPIFIGLKRVLLAIFVYSVALGLLFFINPAFMDTRWPWPLNPFDSRIMAAFPILAGLWALYGYLADDWAEIKSGVHGMLMFSTALFVIWLINVGQFDPARKNGPQFGIIIGLTALTLAYYTYRQERARPDRVPATATAPAD